MSIMKNVYRGGLNLFCALAGPAKTRVVEARMRYGMRLDLRTPRSLAEKVSWLELYADQTLTAELTDKIAVRDFVQQRGLGNLLTPICAGPWSSVAELDFSGLPDAFVMKATHGSGMNFIHKKGEPLNVKELERAARKWLRKSYDRAALEPHYLSIPRRVYCETFLGSEGEPIDYKIHCANGFPLFILVTSERQRALKMNVYDVDWNPLSGALEEHVQQGPEIPRPGRLEEMLEVARTLSRGIPFVRVDLYDVDDDGVRFGELTFSPAGGMFPYFTNEFQVETGGHLRV